MTPFLVAATVVCATSVSFGDDVAIPVTIGEPVGVARRHEPASGGVPFLPGQVKEVGNLALVDAAGKPVPVQFTRLAGYEDGSVQWALLDTMLDVAPNGRAQMKVVSGKAAQPAHPLDIKEQGDLITVDTGLAVFTVNKVKFSVLESVAIGGAAVAGPGELRLVTAEDKTYTGGQSSAVTWEVRGPIRSTLRVDGTYVDDVGNPYIFHTTRLTFWSGSAAVRVAHSLRNSHPTQGFDAKIKEATVSLRLTGLAQERGEGLDWLARGNDRLTLLIVDRHTAGHFPGGFDNEPAWPPRAGEAAPTVEDPRESTSDDSDQPEGAPDLGAKPTTTPTATPSGVRAGPPPVPKIGDLRVTGRRLINPPLHKHGVVDGRAVVYVVPPARQTAKPKAEFGYLDGHFGLADLAHKDSEVWLDFAAPADAASLKARRDALREPLHALADATWISRTGTLTCGAFGTLDDEIATYKKWGWKGIDDLERRRNARLNPVPGAFVSRELMHEESEADSVELYALMYVRTGERGFLDLAQAYAGYYRAHGVWRTDGFVYDGFRHENPNCARASARQSTAAKHGWYGPKDTYGWADTRFHGCHNWACGLIDYYCLTGDMDALEAGLDWAEYAAVTHRTQKPGDRFKPDRKWGRCFGILVRAWQVTRDPKWKKEAETYAQVAVKASNRQPDGLFVVPASYNSKMDKQGVRLSIKFLDEQAPPALKAALQQRGITWKRAGSGIEMSDKTGRTWPLIAIAQTFEYQACVEPLARWAELTGDKEAAKLVVDMANVAIQYAWSPHCDHSISHPFVGLLGPGEPFDPFAYQESHKNCPGNNGGVHSGFYSMFLVDVLMHAYGFSRDPKVLATAAHWWERSSKRGYQQTSQLAAPEEVYQFAGHDAPQGNRVDIRHCKRLFCEVPRAK
jgi:hypothetical protein